MNGNENKNNDKNLLKSIMIKPEPLPEDSFDTTEMIQRSSLDILNVVA